MLLLLMLLLVRLLLIIGLLRRLRWLLLRRLLLLLIVGLLLLLMLLLRQLLLLIIGLLLLRRLSERGQFAALHTHRRLQHILLPEALPRVSFEPNGAHGVTSRHALPALRHDGGRSVTPPGREFEVLEQPPV
ncbi:hypothetical protein T492DRAFT_868656 [Pavlovales sp. CCMP2436]|nr:hypothetical protein T492DRAFT_868656 [Pavlovales sp. CCMP2436]